VGALLSAKIVGVICFNLGVYHLAQCSLNGGSWNTGGPQWSASGFGRKSIAKILRDLKELRVYSYMCVLKVPFLVDQQKRTRISFFSVTPCPSRILENICLSYCIQKCGYGNCNHGCNVSSISLHALLGVGNFTKVVLVCANCLDHGTRWG
jgi:hypothetical protein